MVISEQRLSSLFIQDPDHIRLKAKRRENVGGHIPPKHLLLA